MRGTLEAVEEAFRQHGLKRVQMPPKLYLYFKAGDLRAMPAFLEEQDIAGVKIVNVHPENPKRGLPTVMALMILNSPETGAPIAAMDGTYLTDMRTGAGGGIAVKYLARKDSRIIGLVGAGNQARTQLLAIREVMDIEDVKVTSTRVEHCLAFKKEMEPKISCNIIPKTTIKEVCDCDILVTTTPVRSPVVKNEWVKEGTHINAIGADAPGKEELDPRILTRAKIVVDDLAQAFHSGEINVPLSKGIISLKDIYCELGEVVVGRKPGRERDEEITIFDSTGLAIQDVAAANLIYLRARDKGIGLELTQF
jgi:alanine dehydrogenase